MANLSGGPNAPGGRFRRWLFEGVTVAATARTTQEQAATRASMNLRPTPVSRRGLPAAVIAVFMTAPPFSGRHEMALYCQMCATVKEKGKSASRMTPVSTLPDCRPH